MMNQIVTCLNLKIFWLDLGNTFYNMSLTPDRHFHRNAAVVFTDEGGAGSTWTPSS